MKCRRIEKLIPAYCGEELDPRLADEVKAHLTSCAACEMFANELMESRQWLKEYMPPAFDDHFFDELRTSVHRAIALRTSAEPPPAARMRILVGAQVGIGSFTASITRFRFRVAVATTIASVLIALVCIRLVSHHEVPARGALVTGIVVAPESEGRPPVTHGPERQGLGPTRSSPRPSRKLIHKDQLVDRSDDLAILIPTEASQLKSEAQDQEVRPDSTTGTLRIDIQTDDPNVRIIWITSNLNEPLTQESSDTN